MVASRARPAPRHLEKFVAKTESNEPLRSYKLTAKSFFGAPGSEAGMHSLHIMHRETMHEIIQRYGIEKQKVLSVGPGDCAQEYWFSETGSSLTLVDIDEGGALEPILRKIAAAPQDASIPLTYVIGDARHVADWLETKFDVIFTSGFTPDEAYRADLLGAFGKITGADHSLAPVGVWPPDAKPFSPLCVEIIERGLADNGLYIMLSYASGPDVVRARNYLPMLKEQLTGMGLHLLEVHCQASSPGCHLVVAMKSNDDKAVAARRAHLQALPPLKDIHARSEYNTAALRVEPAPNSINPVNNATFAAGQLGATADIVARHVAPLIERFAPGAKSVYYAGEQTATEGTYLLSRGLAVEYGWEIDITPPPLALAQKLLHASISGTPTVAAPSDQLDLCYLASPAADEELRRTAGADPTNTALPLFASTTLPFVAAKLKTDGVLIYQGRTGGIDLTYDAARLDRMRADLEGAGLVMRELYVMKALPGIFVFSAVKKNAAQARRPVEPPAQNLRFCHVVPDQETVRVWPQAPETTPAASS
jgi:hypothetical protein